MKRFGAVIFDMDGLLLDTERIALESFRRVCHHLQIGDQTEIFIRCIGTNHARGWQVLEEGLRGLVDMTAFRQAWESIHADRAGQKIPVKDGVIELLDDLAAAGIPCGVATSTATDRAIGKLRQVGLFERFASIVGGDQVDRSKPEPDIYLRAAERLKVQPVRCLALEDSENGVRAALGAGMKVIQIPDLVGPSAELRALGHIVLASLHDVRTHEF